MRVSCCLWDFVSLQSMYKLSGNIGTFYLMLFLKFQMKSLVSIFLLGNVSKTCTANGLTPIRVDYVRECGYNPNNTVEENSVSMAFICCCDFNMMFSI